MTPGPFPYTSDDFRAELSRARRNRLLAVLAVVIVIALAIAIIARIFLG